MNAYPLQFVVISNLGPNQAVSILNKLPNSNHRFSDPLRHQSAQMATSITIPYSPSLKNHHSNQVELKRSMMQPFRALKDIEHGQQRNENSIQRETCRLWYEKIALERLISNLIAQLEQKNHLISLLKRELESDNEQVGLNSNSVKQQIRIKHWPQKHRGYNKSLPGNISLQNLMPISHMKLEKQHTGMGQLGKKVHKYSKIKQTNQQLFYRPNQQANHINNHYYSTYHSNQSQQVKYHNNSQTRIIHGIQNPNINHQNPNNFPHKP